MLTAVNYYFGIRVFDSIEDMYRKQSVVLRRFWPQISPPALSIGWISRIFVRVNYHRLVCVWSSSHVPYRPYRDNLLPRFARSFLFLYWVQDDYHIEAVYRAAGRWRVIASGMENILPDTYLTLPRWFERLNAGTVRGSMKILSIYRFKRINGPI
jgi:hypothetical protein